MIKFNDYVLVHNVLSNISTSDLNSTVIEYMKMFDNIAEEPLYVNNGVVIYVCKKNKVMSAWVEYNSNVVIKKKHISRIEDVISALCMHKK